MVTRDIYQDKLKWLKKNKIVTKETPTRSTINRLYSFYHRNPLNTPLYVAYGLQKRIDRSIEKKGGGFELQTPQGKITAKRYIDEKVKNRVNIVKRKLSPQASFAHSKYKKYMHRVQDYLVYRPNITANEENLNKKIEQLRKQILPEIQDDIDLIAKNFRIFYKTPLIGSVSSLKSQDFPQGQGFNYQRVGFIRLYKKQYNKYLDFFIDELLNSLVNGFKLVYKYENMNVTLFKIEIVFTSDLRASMYEKLRVE